MPAQHVLDCPPITAVISEATPGWDEIVRLVRLERSHRAVLDVDGAKNTAIAYARELCRESKVNAPECLNSPDWRVQQSREL